MDLSISLMQVFSVFIVLFALIDVLGSVPIFLSLQNSGKSIHPFRSSLFTFLLMVGFLFVGEGLLRIFHVDVSSFAIAGGLVIFVISLEMVFGVEIFKNDAPGEGKSSFVPVVFPLLAGPASFTALLTMRADNSTLSIIVGVLLNVLFIFFVLSNLKRIRTVIGEGGVYVLRKFFGIIIMAISVGTITKNILALVRASAPTITP